MTKKHISLTTGEPAGIGPDIACMLTNSPLADNILIMQTLNQYFLSFPIFHK